MRPGAARRGLVPRPCVLNADQTDTVDKAHLRERITVLGPEKLKDVCRALARHRLLT